MSLVRIESFAALPRQARQGERHSAGLLAPLYPVPTWNVDATVNNEARTNNLCQSWNLAAGRPSSSVGVATHRRHEERRCGGDD